MSNKTTTLQLRSLPIARWRRLQWIRWAAVGAALGAATYLALAGFQAWRFQIGRNGKSIIALAGLAMLGVYLYRAARRHLLFIVVVPIVLAIIWGVFVQTEQVSDFSTLYKHSQLFGTTFDISWLHASKSAPTIATYGLVFWLVGDGAFVIWTVGALLHGLQTLLLFFVGLRLFGSESLAIRAAAMYGFLPALIGFSPVLSTEAVALTLAIAGMLLLLRWRASPSRLGLLTIAGVVLGLSYLARAPSLAFIVGGVAFTVAESQRIRFSVLARRLGALLLGVMVMLGSQMALNVHYGNSWSFNGSQYSSLSIMNGSNRDTRGGYSTEDLDRIGWKSGMSNEERAAASARARDLGIERIREDVPGFISFALTAKLARMWEQEHATVVRWSLTNDTRTESIEGRAVSVPVDGLYLALLSLSIAGAAVLAWAIRPWRRFRSHPRPWLAVQGGTLTLILIPILGLAAIHIVFSVQGRYHLTFLPMLALLAAFGVEWARDRRSMRSAGSV